MVEVSTSMSVYPRVKQNDCASKLFRDPETRLVFCLKVSQFKLMV
jgi:hypothetical protein